MADRRCVECGAKQRMVGRSPETNVCAICSGEERRAADVPAPVRRFLIGMYDSPSVPTPGQDSASVKEWYAARAAERAKWAGGEG